MAEGKRIAVGADHGGFRMKEMLKKYLSGKGYAVKDFGTDSSEPCDYPLIGYGVARSVSQGRFKRAMLICKTGIGMAIIANKLKNVRSGVCNTVRQARTSREHNDTNVLALAAQYITAEKARKIVDTWLNTKSLGGRHGRRVKEIERLERK